MMVVILSVPFISIETRFVLNAECAAVRPLKLYDSLSPVDGGSAKYGAKRLIDLGSVEIIGRYSYRRDGPSNA